MNLERTTLYNTAPAELGGKPQGSADKPKVEPGVVSSDAVQSTPGEKPPTIVYKQGYNGPMDDKRAEIYQNDLLLGS